MQHLYNGIRQFISLMPCFRLNTSTWSEYLSLLYGR